MSGEALRIAWKFGADTSTSKAGVIVPRLDYFSGQLAGQEAIEGRENFAVISGAVATALAELGMDYEEAREAGITDQMLATSGNILFFAAWKQALERKGLRSGELLITHHEIEDSQEERTFLGNLRDYLTAERWIALINESGSTGDEETKKLAYGGDNDRLAVAVAHRAGADVVNFMTEVEGIFDTQGKLMKEINAGNIDEAMQATADGVYKGRKSKVSKGGMRSKLVAGLDAAEKGMTAHIAHATSNFEDVLDSKTGTLFVPH